VVSGDVSPWQCLRRTVLGGPWRAFQPRHPAASLAQIVEG
jgi:hypothetical protein